MVACGRMRAQIAASDCLLGKVGYGTASECLAHGKPIVYVRRDYFNEEPFLRRLLQARVLSGTMVATDLHVGFA